METRDVEADDEYVTGREFEAVGSDDLENLVLAESWFLGFLVCSEDDLTLVAAWAAQLDENDVDRIRFYLHDDVDEVEAFKPWYAENLPSPKTKPLTLGRRFHRTYGKDHGNQVVRDADALGW